MRITLNIYDPSAGDQDQLLTVEIFPDMSLTTLRESIHGEANIPPSSQHIYHNGRLISDDSKTMEELQIADGEMLAVHVRGPNTVARQASRPQQPAAPQQQQQQQAGSGRAGQDVETLRLRFLGNQALRQQLSQQSPELEAALEDGPRFAQLLHDAQTREQRQRLDRQREIERLNEDPFNAENQAKIEEMIRQERVMENLQNAMEHNPEVFGRVHMLYVDVEVNGHKVKALVDSGAQATIMSPGVAEACGIMRLVDKRFAGVAKGVGTATIMGRVHTAQIKIGSLFLPCSFTVMDGKMVDMLLGLDMLKRYQASIDLGRDRLIIQGTEIPFLGEADIPKDEEPTAVEPTVPGPAGTQIGARSGVVSSASAGSSGSQPQAPPSAAAQAASAQPSSAPQQPQGASGEQVTVSPQHIESLVSMGATREQAIQALQAAGNNVELAAGIIFF